MAALLQFKLFEDDGETIDPEEMGDPEDSKPESNNAENKSTEQNKANTNKDEKSDEKKNDIEYSKNKGNLDWTERNSDDGLKAVYNLFSAGTDRVRIDVSKFKELAEAKKAKDALNHINEIFKNLFETLKKINVEPIVDGFIALDSVENTKNIPGAFEVIGEEKKEDKSNKKDNKEENKENEEQQSEIDKLKEYQNNLLKAIDNSSPIMSNIVSKLNEKVRNAKDDSWINDYNTFEESFKTEGKKILEYLHTIYKGQENAEKWLATQEQKLQDGNFFVRIHHIISMVKFAYKQLDNQIEKANEEDLKKQQQNGTINSSFKPNNTEPVINEAEAKVHSVETTTAALEELQDKIDFNEILPTDYKNEMYGFSEDAANAFNNAEAKISKIIGLYKDAQSNKNSLFSMVNTLVGTNKADNDVLKGVDINKLPCKKCIEHFNYDTRSQETKGVDRNIYFLYGCIRAIIACLNQLDDKTKEGNERTVQGEKPQEESTIPELSSNTLMNEIYKYIRGN